MAIDFDSIKSYNPVKGFGFIGCTFCNQNEEVFFHIKKIKREHLELAQKLDNGEAFEAVSFWYEVETTEKGRSVSSFWLSTENIPQKYRHELCTFVQKVESVWKDTNSLKPDWLDFATIELIGTARRHELSSERDNLESQCIAAEAERRREEVLRNNEIERLANAHSLSRVKANELYQLLIDVLPLKLIYSKDLSAYIRKHKIGYKYPNISGIVRMREEDIEWDFSGGFPSSVYKIICTELSLINQGTRARPVGFTSFQDAVDSGIQF